MRASSLGNLETFAMLLFAGSALATIIPTAIPLPPTKIDHTLFTALQKKTLPANINHSTDFIKLFAIRLFLGVLKSV